MTASYGRHSLVELQPNSEPAVAETLLLQRSVKPTTVGNCGDQPKESQTQPANRAIFLTADSAQRPGVPGAANLFRNPAVLVRDIGFAAVLAVGMVLVRILRVGVCGSDIHSVQTDSEGRPLFSGPAANWDRGIVLGHEFVGEVVRSGPGVTLPPGTLVTGDSLVPCRSSECTTCEAGLYNYCPNAYLIGLEANGVFTEYATLPARSLHRIDRLVKRVGRRAAIRLAVLAEPAGVGLNAYCDAERKLHRWERTALIYGGGAIGVLSAVAAKYRGCYPVVIVEPNPIRAEIAAKFADYVQHPDDLCPEFLGNAFDVDGPSIIINAAGDIDFASAMELMAPAGEATTVARSGKNICFPPDGMITGGKGLAGARGHVGFVPRAMRIMADPRFDLSPLITKELHSLDELAAMLSRPELFADELKVVCDICDY